MKENQHIDIVIAWVDGADPIHKNKRLKFLNKSQEIILPGNDATRFHSLNEVEYCVLSILKFASFVRNIFIVTDNQDPKISAAVQKYFPKRLKSIRIVDHTEIFKGYEHFLPTFNSICISNMLWRIKGLSNQFVYFNDDIFLLRKITSSDWFRRGRPVLRGSWSTPPYERILWDQLKHFFLSFSKSQKDIKLAASFQLNQWKAATKLGFNFRYFKSGHTPLAMDRDRLETYFYSHPEVLEKNISHRFRNYSQFNTVSLANHLEINSGNTNLEKSQAVYLQPHNRGDKYVEKKFNLCKSDKSKLFICAQSLDLANEKDQMNVLKTMRAILKLD